jgi:RNA polymerase sigma-70 factor (ECF subfamily)
VAAAAVAYDRCVTRSDSQLLDAARRGDEQAMNELLAHHEEQIYRFGLRMCGNEDDARDVLQETMLSAFRGLTGFRGEARLSTWLYQIARSFCIKLRRSGSSVRADAALDSSLAQRVAAPVPAPDEGTHAREIGAALSAAIYMLPEAAREALVLRDVEGLSAEEAAAVAGIEVAALKSRLHRARVEVRANLTTLLGEAAHVAGPPPCPDLANEISAYAAADLDQAACARLEAHLSSCARCAGACEALKRTVSLCRQLPGGEVPAAVRTAVRHAIRAALPATR